MSTPLEQRIAAYRKSAGLDTATAPLPIAGKTPDLDARIAAFRKDSGLDTAAQAPASPAKPIALPTGPAPKATQDVARATLPPSRPERAASSRPKPPTHEVAAAPEEVHLGAGKVYEKNGRRVYDSANADPGGATRPTHIVDSIAKRLHNGESVEDLEGRVLARHDFTNDTLPSSDENALRPDTRAKADDLIAAAARDGVHLSVGETKRSQERQDWLFQSGRSRPGPIVTWTLTSDHGPGDALDLHSDDPKGYEWLQEHAHKFGFRSLGAMDPGHIAADRDSAHPTPTLPLPQGRVASQQDATRAVLPSERHKNGLAASVVDAFTAGATPGIVDQGESLEHALIDNPDPKMMGRTVVPEGRVAVGSFHQLPGHTEPTKRAAIKGGDIVDAAAAAGLATKEGGYMAALGPLASKVGEAIASIGPSISAGLPSAVARLTAAIAERTGLPKHLAEAVAGKAAGMIEHGVHAAPSGVAFGALHDAAEGQKPTAGGLAGMGAAAMGLEATRGLTDRPLSFSKELASPADALRAHPSDASPYTILGVEPNASDADITHEWKRQVVSVRKSNLADAEALESKLNAARSKIRQERAAGGEPSEQPTHTPEPPQGAQKPPAEATTEQKAPEATAAAQGEPSEAETPTLRQRIANFLDPERATRIDQLERERRAATDEAYTSSVTGLPNHRAFKKAIVRAEKDPAMGIASIDANDFKGVNDRAGHDAGDAALKDIGAALQETAKLYGVDPRNVFHQGGDEFSVIAPHDVLPRILSHAEDYFGTRDYGGAATSISSGHGNTFAEADANLLSRKAARKAASAPAATPEATPPAQSATEHSSAVEHSIEHGDVVPLHRSQIRMLPAVMQYKTKGIKSDGVSDEFRDVEVWDPIKAGVQQVWRAPADEVVNGEHIRAGDIVNVNGHHRLELANRLGVDRPLNVQFIDAANADEAKRVGALTNIAEGKGSAIDAAHMLRGLSIQPDEIPAYMKKNGISLKGSVARDGIALSNLAPTIFNDVAIGKTPEARGVVIGSAGLTHQQQYELLKMAPEKFSNAQLAELARDVRDSGTETVHQETLFGNEATEVSLAPARAKISAWVKDAISKDARLFKFLSKADRASTIEGSGVGKVDTAAAKGLASEGATATELYDRLSNRAGPIGRILTDAARRVVNGEKESDVRAAILPAVHDAIRGEAGSGSNGARAQGVRQDSPDGDAGPAVVVEHQPAESKPLDVAHLDNETGALFERGPEYDGRTPDTPSDRMHHLLNQASESLDTEGMAAPGVDHDEYLWERGELPDDPIEQERIEKAEAAERRSQMRVLEKRPGYGAIRQHGIPADTPFITSGTYDGTAVRANPDYTAAKHGDIGAATRVVRSMVDGATVARARKEFGSDVVYLAPIAQEATGANALPAALAQRYAIGTGARVGMGVVQANRAFHTGANLMDRLISPVHFDGPIEKGARYVLVDDVISSGGTLAALSDYVQRNGGKVAGVVTLATGSRSGQLVAPKAVTTEIERRFGDVIRSEFGVEPTALTADEARYIHGFRDADELRNRAAAARTKRAERLRSKGVRPSGSEDVGGAPDSVREQPSSYPSSDNSDQTFAAREASPQYGDVTASPAFRRWFKESKVVDGAGNPLVVYHGTTNDVAIFSLAKTGMRTGNRYGRGAIFFTSNPAAASAYAAVPGRDVHPLDRPNVIAAYLSLQNPIEIDAGDRSWTTVAHHIRSAQRNGYDGAIVRNVLDHASAVTAVQEGPVDVFVAFKPNQIKSATGNRGTFDTSGNILKENAPVYGADASPWYSRVERAIENAPFNKGTGQQWLAALAQTSKAEREWIGMEKALKPAESFTRDEVLELARKNAIKLGETVTPSKSVSQKPGRSYETYTLPGGKNYREIKIQLGDEFTGTTADAMWQDATNRARVLESDYAEGHITGDDYRVERAEINALKNKAEDLRQKGFRSPHHDEQNILAHLRVDDRPLPDGKKLLFGEELQSDWQQKGRALGFRKSSTFTKDDLVATRVKSLDRHSDGHWIVNTRAGDTINVYSPTEAPTEAHAIELGLRDANDQNTSGDLTPGVPDMPYKKTEDVTALMLKRLIQEAVRGGYDVVAWTTGAQQADRYKLSNRIDSIIYSHEPDGKWWVGASKDGKNLSGLANKPMDEQELEQTFGKEMATKIVNGEGESVVGGPEKELRGIALDVGGEGMKKYYDEIIPNVLKKVGKQLGVKIEIAPLRETVDGAHDKEALVDEQDKLHREVIDLRRRPYIDLTAEQRARLSEVESRVDALTARIHEASHYVSIEHNPSIRITPELRAAVDRGMPVMERGPDYDLFGAPSSSSSSAKVAKTDEQPSLLPEPAPARGLTQAEVEAKQLVSFLRGKVERGAATKDEKDRYLAAQALVRRNEKIGSSEISRVRRDDAAPEIPTLLGQQALFERNRPISASQMRAQHELVFGSVEAASEVAKQTLEDAGPAHAFITLPGAPAVADRIAAVRAGEMAFVTVPAIGQKVSAEKPFTDLFGIMRAYRNPKAEYFSMIIVQRGKIVEHHMTTTGSIDTALVSLSDIAQAAARAKAIGGKVYLVHNHPSGDPTPSHEDISITREAKDVVEKAGAEWGGHLVINHVRATLLDGLGGSTPVTLPRTKTDVDWTDTSGDKIRGPAGILTMLGHLPQDAGRVDVLVLNTQHAIVAYTARPISDLDTIGDWGIQMMRDAAGVTFAFGTHGQEAFDAVRSAVAKASVPTIDVLDTKLNRSAVEMGFHDASAQPPMMRRVFDKESEYGAGSEDDATDNAGRAGEPRSVRERRAAGGDGPPVSGTEGGGDDGDASDGSSGSEVGTEDQIKGLLRQMSAGKARASDIAVEALQSARRRYARASREQSIQFIDDIERGRTPADPQDAAAARLASTMLMQRRQQVQALGTGKLEHFIDNYFPHVWKDPDQSTIGKILGQRPLEGPKSFMKKRSIPFTTDGINAGLEPVSWNPIDLVLLKAREMDRYIFAQKMIAQAKARGLARFFHAAQGMPEGWSRVNDNMFTVHGPPTDDGAMTILGYWGAPDEVADILNRFLAPGIIGNRLIPENQRTAFRLAQRANNALNAAQLGFSAFHATAESINSVISMVGLSMEEALAGHGRAALRHLVISPIAPVEQVMKGNRLLKEWAKPGTTSHEVQRTVDRLVAGGYHARADEAFRMNSIQALQHALSENNALMKAAGLRHVPGALIDLFAKPIMEGLVPRLKIAAAYDMAKFAMDDLANQGITDDAIIRQRMYEVVRSVDNRFGQLALDNLFWSRTKSDMLGLLVRSRGWTWGSINEIGGGVVDLKDMPGVVADMFKSPRNHQLVGGTDEQPMMGGQGSQKPLRRLSPRTSHAVALVLVTAMMGAVLNYLLTGEAPKDLKDYYFPRTGKTRPDGSEDRISLPTYMKDVVAFGRHPIETLEHKAGPLINMFFDVKRNKDYYGQEIIPHEGTLGAKVSSAAKYVGRSSLPLGVRGVMQMKEGREGGRALLPLIGLTPAPSTITRSEFQNFVAERVQEKIPDSARTEAEIMRARRKRDAETAIRNGAAADMSGMTAAEKHDIRTSAKLSADENRFKRLSLEDQIVAYGIATPEERTKNHLAKHIWSPTLQRRLDNLEPEVRKEVKVRLRELRRPTAAR